MILVINTGSSSIKMAVIDMPSERTLADGIADRLNEPGAALRWHIGEQDMQTTLTVSDHASAMQTMLDSLFMVIDRQSIKGVGHRVVHGGESFFSPTPINPSVIEDIEALSHLAPLHNPANLSGIRAALAQLPTVAHIAVFDTAFHHNMPLHASLYAVPYAWYSDYGARRYGFHGTSHHYVGLEAARLLGREFPDCRMITAHLGNGCSAAAIRNGMSIDTTMGMTPLEGLVMGTRSGDVDPGLHDYIARQSGASLEEITATMNRKSGLLGLSGLSNDMRTLLQAADAGDKRATLAVDIFCYRLAKSLAALAVPLGRVDALIFTGGIGEHAAAIRDKTVQLLVILGLSLDAVRNQQHGRLSHGQINSADSRFPVLVIATDEEKMIARYTDESLRNKERSS